ncbi:MAG: polyphosphate polymerase domain-containing protein [Rikenellaceae bacterium]
MKINSAINQFAPIVLSQMDGVTLMNRTDRKYWFSATELSALLNEVSSDYFILEIEGERALPYSSIYYDTPRNEMFADHHRGKLNRYKVRRRSYLATGSSFLEVKFKSNKGRTIKRRQSSEYGSLRFSPCDSEFIESNTPYRSDELTPTLESHFRRIMLVSRDMNERCTIDCEVHFKDGERCGSLPNITIVEVKSDGRQRSSIAEALQRRRIRPSGFSKYFVGRSMIGEGLKHNRFKSLQRKLGVRS